MAQVNKKRVATLAGPDLVKYLSLYPSKVKYVEIWENNPSVMMRQIDLIRELHDKTVSYRFGDIINATPRKDTFYDLDFCSTIQTVKDHLRRFKDCAFSATFSTRFYSVEKTLIDFLEAVGEHAILDIPHPQFRLLETNKNKYLYTTYYDGTHMMIIFKFH